MKKCINLLMIFGASLLLAGCGDTTEPQNEEQQEQKQNDAASEDNPGEATTDEQTDEDAKSDEPEEKVCPAGFTGENCDQCKEGFVGDNCDECAENLAGENCDIVNSCVHGTPNLGINGDGHCAVDSCADHYIGFDCNECLENFTGENCNDCNTDWAGENCDIRNSCVHGIPNLGVNGDGHCSECTDVFWGPDCDQVYFCVNGIPNVGVDGDGHCLDCNSDWSGNNCDIANECQNGAANIGLNGNGHCLPESCSGGFYGDDCDTCDFAKGYGRNCTLYGTMQDGTGKEYKTTFIFGKTWMAENMAYKTNVNCLIDPKVGYFYYDYGCLYTWDDAKKVCPTGWHLPSKQDFDDLLTYVGNNKTSSSNFLALIAKSSAWSNYSEQGGDDFGFWGLPAGFYGSGYYLNLGEFGIFWSSTENYSTYAYGLQLGDDYALVGYYDEPNGFSVRCIKD